MGVRPSTGHVGSATPDSHAWRRSTGCVPKIDTPLRQIATIAAPAPALLPGREGPRGWYRICFAIRMDLQTVGYLLFSVGVIAVAGGFLMIAFRPPTPPAAAGRASSDERSGIQRWPLDRLL